MLLAGALSIGLMGEVKAAWELWEIYGELPWRELFQPAIQLARDGVNVTWALADAIATEEEAIRSDPGLRFVKHHQGAWVDDCSGVARVTGALTKKYLYIFKCLQNVYAYY